MKMENEFFMLVDLYSQNQWSEGYSLRLYNAKDKLACCLSVWEECCSYIEHEFEDDYLIRKNQFFENLENGIDQTITNLEFETEWDGYDSYSLRILASGYLDEFIERAIKETVEYLYICKDKCQEEKDDNYEEDEQQYIDKLTFIEDETKVLKGLILDNKTSAQNKLQGLRKSISEIDK